MRRRAWIAAGVLAAGALAWFLFAPRPLPVETTKVVRGPMQVTVNNEGKIRVHDRYVIAAPVAAEMARIELHEGDPVRKGQAVALLNPLPMDTRQRQEAQARLDAARALAREAALRVRRADADLQLAESEHARLERLVKNAFVSPQALEKAVTAEKTSRAESHAARSREQAALADVQAAQAALQGAALPAGARPPQLPLASPVDGVVLKVNETSERTVAAGTPLVTLGDPMRYEIVVDVLSTDAVRIKPGDAMLLEGWGGGKTLRAQVRLVEPGAFTKISALGVEEQRVNVIGDPVDPLGPLGDGYRIEARIVVWSSPDTVKVAGSSLFRVGADWHVFAVENGRAHQRKVTLGQRNQDEAQILSGLVPGALVVRYPGNELREDMRVTPIAARP